MDNGISQIGSLTVYAFDASLLGVFGQPASVAGRFVPIGPDDVLTASGASAALDGVQFDTCDSAPYATSQCGVPVFMVYDSARGVSVAGSHPNEGMTISVANGQAVAMSGSQMAAGAQVAVQLWPSLVSGGQVVVSNSGTNATAERRAALAIISPNQLAFVVGAANMVDFANAIAALGATDAGYTDGGGSTSLVTQGGFFGASEHRRVPTWLIASSGGLSGAISSAFGNGLSNGMAAIVSVVVAVAAVGAIYLAMTAQPKRRVALARRNPRRRRRYAS